MTEQNDDFLDDLFATARKPAAAPSNDLMARVMADARATQAGFAAPAQTEPTGLMARMLDVLGGWPTVSGLAAATVAGVWIGVAPPQSVSDLTASLLGDEVSIGLSPLGGGFEFEGLLDG